jgi:hypothetical protein
MEMRSMADLIIIDTLRKKVDEVEAMNAELLEALAIIVDVLDEIPEQTDNENILEIVEFLEAVATGDYEELYEEEIADDLEELDNDDPFRYRS